ncbi:MAG: NACHT domain-containing protein [Planctomycetota bacterium]
MSRQLRDYVLNDAWNAKPLLLTGARGTGKTALLVQLSEELKAETPDLKIFATLGDEARNRDLREIVRVQCLGLRQALNLDIPVGHEWGSLLESFRRILVRIPEGIRVLLIVDGLEQMQLPPAYFGNTSLDAQAKLALDASAWIPKPLRVRR